MNPSSSTTSIKVLDILVWSISETHAEIHRSMSLWRAQGVRFVRQEKLWKAAEKLNGEIVLSEDLAMSFLEEEAQTIKDRYCPRRLQKQSSLSTDAKSTAIAARRREFDNLEINSSTLQEEHERELTPETERERQIQRAPPAKPAQHSLHPDVVQSAMTGNVKARSEAYGPAFAILKQTSAKNLFATSLLEADQRLLATTDFAESVEGIDASFRFDLSHVAARVLGPKPRATKLSGAVKTTPAPFVSDNFLRSVQWVLTRCAEGSNEIGYIMIVSP